MANVKMPLHCSSASQRTGRLHPTTQRGSGGAMPSRQAIRTTRDAATAGARSAATTRSVESDRAYMGVPPRGGPATRIQRPLGHPPAMKSATPGEVAAQGSFRRWKTAPCPNQVLAGDNELFREDLGMLPEPPGHAPMHRRHSPHWDDVDRCQPKHGLMRLIR